MHPLKIAPLPRFLANIAASAPPLIPLLDDEGRFCIPHAGRLAVNNSVYINKHLAEAEAVNDIAIVPNDRHSLIPNVAISKLALPRHIPPRLGGDGFKF